MPDNSGTTPSEPHLVFQSLKTQFETASELYPKFNIYAVKSGKGLVTPAIVRLEDLTNTIFARHVGFTPRGPLMKRVLDVMERFIFKCGGWEAIGGDEEQEISWGSGEQKAFDVYKQLATRAGALLPDAFTTGQYSLPVCSFERVPKVKVDVIGKWSLFVFHSLRQTAQFRLLQKHDESAFYQCEPGSQLATYAYLTSGIFAGSAAVCGNEFLTGANANRVSPDQDPPLSERKYDILDAIYELKGFNPETRVRTEEIADYLTLDSAQLKEPISELVQLESLLHSKKGRGGGVWLSEAGKRHVERQRKR